MTSPHHPSGTDRCLEAYQLSGLQADCILNVQGDEPFVDAQQLNALAQLIARPDVSIATLVKTITDAETLFDASKVKVVMNAHSQALYFSRQAIPFNRNSEQAVWLSQHTYYKHLGLYAYKPKVLREICALSPSSLEKAESLEQLRQSRWRFTAGALPKVTCWQAQARAKSCSANRFQLHSVEATQVFTEKAPATQVSVASALLT